MNWLALLGVISAAYGVFVVYLSITKKPEKIWNMGKVQGFVKVMGDIGTRIFFAIFGLGLIGLGVWLIIK